MSFLLSKIPNNDTLDGLDRESVCQTRGLYKGVCTIGDSVSYHSCLAPQRDWGHMVFTDMTLTQFLLVMIFPSTCSKYWQSPISDMSLNPPSVDCGNYSHHDYDALTKYHADRFMSLLKYLHHAEGPPDW